MTQSMIPPLENEPNFYPLSVEDVENTFIRFHADPFLMPNGASYLIFKIVEDKSSRVVGSSYEFAYDVFVDPPLPELFTYYIDYGTYIGTGFQPDVGTAVTSLRVHALSDEVIIGWNLWDWASWTFFDMALCKKWPMTCTRVSHNTYRVVIHYTPLNILNFQIAPTKTKLLYGMKSFGWVKDETIGTGGEFKVIVVDGNDIEAHKKQMALRAINTDASGKIEGVDKIEPSFTWTERWIHGPYDVFAYLENEDAEPGAEYYKMYLMMLGDLVATLNEYAFRNLPRGTVLFEGATGRNVGPMTWEIDYKFSFKPIPRNSEGNEGFYEMGPYMIELPINEDPFIGSGHLHIDPMALRKGTDVTLEGRPFILQSVELLKVHQIYPVADFADLHLHEEVPLGRGRFMGKTNELPEMEQKERKYAGPGSNQYKCLVYHVP